MAPETRAVTGGARGDDATRSGQRMARVIVEAPPQGGRGGVTQGGASPLPLLRRTGLRLWLLFLLLLLPLVVHGVVVEVGNRQARYQHTLDMLRDRVDSAAQLESVLFTAAQDILRTLAQIDAVRSGDPADCSRTLARIAAQYRQYTALVRTDGQGRVTCASQPLGRPMDIPEAPADGAGRLSPSGTVTPVTTGPLSGRRVIGFSQPVLDPSGGLLATVRTWLDLAWFEKELTGIVPADEGWLMLFDARGNVLAQVPPGNPKPVPRGGPAPAVSVAGSPLAALVAGDREGSGTFTDADGRRMVATFTTLEDMPGGLHIVATQPAAAIDADLDRNLRDRLAVLATVILLSMAAFWVAADLLILRGVRSLIGQAVRLARGDRRARSAMPPTAAAELGQLARAYDQMAEELTARERALEASEARLRLALEAAAMGMIDCDLGSGLVVRSPLVDALFGFPQDGAERHMEAYFARVHPEDVQAVRTALDGAEEGGVIDVDYRVLPSGGGVRWVAARGEILRGADDGSRRCLAVLRDVTERHRIEGALLESEERFRTMAETVPDMLFVNRPDGSLEYQSRRFRTLTGPEPGAGEGWAAILHPEERDGFLGAWEESCRKGGTFECECRLRMADGGFRWFLVRANPLRAEDGPPRRWMGSATDIDRRKRAEQALSQARLEAEQADRAKSRFLAAASHDLRQPLNAMSLFLGVLQSHVDAKGAGVLQQAQSSLDAMIELFNALLDLSKLESGAVEAEVGPVPASSLLERLRTDFAGVARAKGLDLRVVPSRSLLRSDGPLLERILRNLVSNAVRYTESGRVLVGCRRRGGALRIDVYDTGPGIRAEDQSRIFEEFTQLANPARQRRGGHGLGLAIAKRTADLLGHPIEVAGTPGRGSRFSVTVPLAGEPSGATPAAPAGADAAGPVRGMRKRVWVIEDDPLVSVAMALALRELGCEVVSLENAAAAVALAEGAAERAAGGVPPPDLVISDYRLPGGMDGVAVVGAIRERFGAAVAACIVTGDPADDIGPLASRVGARLLRKPIRAGDLARLLAAT